MITIRRATLDDRPEIFRLIQQAYGQRGQYKIPDRWEWLFVNNPSLRKFELPVFIAVEDTGKFVGQSCAMLEQVKIGSEFYRLGWAVDTVVLPEYRGQGIASKLQKINDESQEFYMALWMESIASRKIKMSLGSVDLDPVPVYRRYLMFTPDIFRYATLGRDAENQSRLKRWFSGRLRLSFLNRFVVFVRNSWHDLWNQQIVQKPDQSLGLTEVDTFPEDVDQLWERLSSKFYAIVKRDRIHLNWKYVDQPHMDYRRVVARRKGEICGYLVMRKGKPPERNKGVISDFFVDPSDERAISTLLSFAVSYFRQQKVTEIITATTIPEYQSCLGRLGFVKTGESYPVIHARVKSPAVKMALEPGMWFLGRSDHDWDQYPYEG